jgi:hypothetical protein
MKGRGCVRKFRRKELKLVWRLWSILTIDKIKIRELIDQERSRPLRSVTKQKLVYDEDIHFYFLLNNTPLFLYIRCIVFGTKIKEPI